MISALLGGIGLFLLGMILMTEGLKASAGDALRDLLQRFTGGRLSAFASGMTITALVQSSSATTLATIGFVSAGLLTFSQAVGVIIGAAVGTTSTGWIVATLGLRFSVSAIALPLVGVGALLRLLTRGRSAAVGLSLAGFGLIFVGIDTLQLGMQSVSDQLDLSGIGADNLPQRLLLVLIGLAMTVIMQSSSAAVATTLAALHTGTIGFNQAAALVIGQNVGTSVTSGIASIGASIAARRTSVAHIGFNTFSGVVAFIAMPLFLSGLDSVMQHTGAGPAIGIAVFHSAFNVVGAAVILPLIGPYSAFITRLVPERKPAITGNLDRSVLSVPAVALEAARQTVWEITDAVLRNALQAVRPPVAADAAETGTAAAGVALSETRAFLSGVHSSPEAARDYHLHLSVLHAIDHLERMVAALESPFPPEVLRGDPALKDAADLLGKALDNTLAWLEDESGAVAPPEMESVSQSLAKTRREHRPAVLAHTVSGEISPAVALRSLDAMRWLDRLAYHAWRTVHHLEGREPGVVEDDLAHDDALPQPGASGGQEFAV